jgi:hypothetical protein
MTETRARTHTGGCQCGAVRYALLAEPYDPHICHCRMCQKAFGSPFAPLAVIDVADFEWSRGRPATFASSATVARGFCADCGTPLTFYDTGTDQIEISIGSLDQPARVCPETQIGVESRLPWFADLAGLPDKTTEAAFGADQVARIESRQHPDHDTDG